MTSNHSNSFFHFMHKDFSPSRPDYPHNIYSSPSTSWHRSEKTIPHPIVGRLGRDKSFLETNYLGRFRKTPDATSFFTWKESFDLRGFVDGELWRQAILEGWGTSLLVWLTGLAAYSLVPRVSDFASGALFPALLGSIVNAISLSLLILCTGSISGGHINPLITIGTFFSRLTTFPRTILYLFFQTAGATTASFLMRISLGTSDGRETVILGCSIDKSAVTAGQAVIFETMTCLSLIFVAYGVGLHPQQKAIYSPALGPLLIGLALGLCTFVTAALKPGYTGASMNPARCFGLMAAEGRWDLHWVHWVGPIVAGALNAAIYWVIPSNK